MIHFSTHPEGGYRLLAKQFFDVPIEELFSFFGDAQQLETITPPWLHFKILTPLPIDMHVGTLIDYRIKLKGIPIRWRTEISEWDPPHRFADQQLRGPYRRWYHVHRFRSIEGGTLVEDDVHYRVPLGDWVHRFFVRGDLQRIFEFRYRRLSELFPTSSLPPLEAKTI